MAMGNVLPKVVPSLMAKRCAAAQTLAAQRFAGWAFFIAGLGGSVWLTLPLILIGAVLLFTQRAAPVRKAEGSRVLAQSKGFELFLRTADANQLRFEEGQNRFRYASGEQAWQLWVNHYGPTKSLAASLDDARREELRRDLVAWHETFASGLGYEQPRDYLIVHGVRRSR